MYSSTIGMLLVTALEVMLFCVFSYRIYYTDGGANAIARRVSVCLICKSGFGHLLG